MSPVAKDVILHGSWDKNTRTRTGKIKITYATPQIY